MHRTNFTLASDGNSRKKNGQLLVNFLNHPQKQRNFNDFQPLIHHVKVVL